MIAKADFGKRKRGRDRSDVPILVERASTTSGSSLAVNDATDCAELLEVAKNSEGPAKVLLQSEQLPYRTLNAYLQTVLITQTEDVFPPQVVDLGLRVAHTQRPYLSPSGEWRPKGGPLHHVDVIMDVEVIDVMFRWL